MTTTAASSTVSITNHEQNSASNNGFLTLPPTPSGSNSNGNRTIGRRALDMTYPPTIQADYGGKIFSHQLSRLRQLPVYDTESNLVPTDQLWNQLHPGTLIMLNADLVCRIYDDDKRRKVCLKVSIKYQ